MVNPDLANSSDPSKPHGLSYILRGHRTRSLTQDLSQGQGEKGQEGDGVAHLYRNLKLCGSQSGGGGGEVSASLPPHVHNSSLSEWTCISCSSQPGHICEAVLTISNLQTRPLSLREICTEKI